MVSGGRRLAKSSNWLYDLAKLPMRHWQKPTLKILHDLEDFQGCGNDNEIASTPLTMSRR
jgi:hypothetical protein